MAPKKKAVRKAKVVNLRFSAPPGSAAGEVALERVIDLAYEIGDDQFDLKHGWKKQVAIMMGITPGVLYKIMSDHYGTGHLGLRMVDKIATKLRIPLSQFVDRDETPSW